MSKLVDHNFLSSRLSDLTGSDNWYAAYSGGLDSTVLLHMLQRWVAEHAPAPTLRALHVNHALQDAAPAWEAHCTQVCERLQIPLDTVRVTVKSGGHGLEAAARAARYRVFEDQLGRGDVVFLAHQLDDQVETFFLRLMRGAGVQGLAAMPQRRALGSGWVVRPLLDLTRGELEDYARRHQLACIEDPSNDDNRLDRNYLRNKVLPLLASRWPAYRQTVFRASEHIASAAQALEQAVPLPATRFSLMGDPGISLDLLLDSGGAGAAAVLRRWLRSGGYPVPDQAPLTEFLRQLREADNSAAPRLQTGAYALQRYRDAVYLLPPELERLPECMDLRPGASLDLPGVGRVGLEPGEGEGLWLAPDDSPQLRWRAGGESFRPAGRRHSTRLKKLLQEQGVPPWWRDRVPLLYLEGELQVVGGRWPCHDSRYGSCGRAGERCYHFTWEATIRGGYD